MSTREERGTTQTATASRKALTTQIDDSGLACSCLAMLGSAVLAMLPSRTDMARPIEYLNMAQLRWVGGKPSVAAISLGTEMVNSDILRTAPRLPRRAWSARHDPAV